MSKDPKEPKIHAHEIRQKAQESRKSKHSLQPVELRDSKGRLLKGSPTMNPGGRPKGLAAYIREITDDNKDQARFFVKLANNQVKGATMRDVVEAHKWLADRGSGKAVELSAVAQIGSEERGELADVAADTLLSFLNALDSPQPAPMLERVIEPPALPKAEPAPVQICEENVHPNKDK